MKGSNKKHGLSTQPIYDCWIAMKARCNNPQHPMFKHYGGRGIKVCGRWSSFNNFFKDMKIPKKGYTLERINNNGDYKLNNCKWITLQEQQKNKRNSNPITGVCWEEGRNKWRADITSEGIKHFLGRFHSLEEAREVRNQAESVLWV